MPVFREGIVTASMDAVLGGMNVLTSLNGNNGNGTGAVAADQKKEK